MDFQPPSIDKSGLNDGQSLLGMEHWIQVARNLGEEWNYESTIKRSESMDSEIRISTCLNPLINTKQNSVA